MPRIHQLGKWGEEKAIVLLKRAGFSEVQDMNAERCNQPFCDIYAERNGGRYLVSVKTRNLYEVNAGRKNSLNPRYNWSKRNIDVDKLMRERDATLAWIAIAVVPENQTFRAFFVTKDKIRETEKQFAILMSPEHWKDYEHLSDPLEEFDQAIHTEWSNGAYSKK